MTGGLAITLFVIALVACIMLHELGHLVTARRFGMRADRYFLGFGPTLWAVRRGETEYGVKAFPLGGFVRIRGMSPADERLRPVAEQVFTAEALTVDRQAAATAAGVDPLSVGNLPDPTWRRLEEELRARGASRDLAARIVRRTWSSLPEHPTADDARSALTEVVATEVEATARFGDLHHRLLRGDDGRFFHDRPAWQRAVVLVAGSAMHFVIAFVVLLAALLTLPWPSGEVVPVVGAVVEDSPAEEAGLEAGDHLLAVQDLRADDYELLREEIRGRAGEPTTLLVERDGEEVALEVVPEAADDPVTGEVVGQAGFFPSEGTRRYEPMEALHAATVGDIGIVAMTVASVEALGMVFSPDGLSQLAAQTTGDQDRGLEGAVSLVGAAQLAGQSTATDFGVLGLLMLVVGINIFVGIFNLVPLPPLDGGHLAVLGIERAVNAWRRARGRVPDFAVDPRAIAAVAIPVLAVLGTVFVTLLWLDITNPIQL